MSMSKRDYEAVARILRERRAEATPEQEQIIRSIAEDLSTHFEYTNPRFEPDIFRYEALERGS